MVRIANNRRRRRAVIAPLIGVMLLVMLGFVVLTVDLGYIYTARAEMQAVADSSALAGASGLMSMGSTARQRALDFGTLNTVAQLAVAHQELNVVIGNWSGVSLTFTPTPDNGVNGVLPNAVRVTGDRVALPLFFAPVIGKNTSEIKRGAIALVGSGSCAGVWGIDGITASGDILTDSYDARQGQYGPGNIRPNGDVCSCGDIVVNGSVNILGDAMYGNGYAFVPSGNSYEVRGVIGEQTCGVPPTNPDFAAAAATNDNGTIGNTYRNRDPFAGNPWHLYVTGNDHLTLAGGTYYFNSALVDGQAYIDITGPTVIYVDGPATFTGGGIFNRTLDPRNLVIYAAGPTLRLQGNAGFYGSVVAPAADIILEGTADYYGAFLGKTLDIAGNASIHVDEGSVFDLFGIRSVDPILIQ